MSIGISYLKIRKNPASRILRLRRVALSDIYSSDAVRSCPEAPLIREVNTHVGASTLEWVLFCHQSIAVTL